MHVNEVSGQIVDAAVRIHAKLGPGLLESVYQAILARDLSRRGLFVEAEKHISFEYEGLRFENAYRADLIVERAVVVEVKSVVHLPAVADKQLLTYVRLLDLRLGLLLNFGAALMKDGIRRIVNKL